MKPTLLALAFLLPACNEVDEAITVRPDGSVRVVMSSKGKPEDVADGYPIALRAPWSPQDDATREWLRLVGPDLGGEAARASAAQLVPGSIVFHDKDNVRLSVAADFRSVDDIPRFLAPESETYRTAFLERLTRLDVRSAGGRTVYVFERRYPAREFARYDVWTRMKAALPKPLAQSLEQGDKVEPGDRVELATAAKAALDGSLAAFLDDALASIYTQGEADLALAGLDRVRAATTAAIAAVVTEARVRRLVELALSADADESKQAESDLPVFEREMRAALRNGLEAALEAEGLPLTTRHAVRGQLEWHLSACDASNDLGDDLLTLDVTLPGRIVGGNAKSLAGSTAHFEAHGDAVRDHEVLFRAVAVVE